jgi:hypothetical protein
MTKPRHRLSPSRDAASLAPALTSSRRGPVTQSGCRPLFLRDCRDRRRGAGIHGADVRRRAAGGPSVSWSPAVARSAVSERSRVIRSVEALTHRFTDAQTLAPLLGGLALIFVLVVWQYHARPPPRT